ncbi:hypothetical protein P7K49_018558 [Saguinus oedipus]|uniref:Uncharacterized protein n=1 Tax=Saguinus oedipus TaxID=9490 RepID=A0ABQ9V5P8_SAGOE|nr:hypothetical protein P7K49_018558 [Saguinus oedipus]
MQSLSYHTLTQRMKPPPCFIHKLFHQMIITRLPGSLPTNARSVPLHTSLQMSPKTCRTHIFSAFSGLHNLPQLFPQPGLPFCPLLYSPKNQKVTVITLGSCAWCMIDENS